MAEGKRERERGYYRDEGRARHYDERTSRGSSVERQHEAARRVRDLLERGRVLDIGCGTARMLIEMARMLPDVHFTGMDVSAEMVSIGLENIAHEDLSGRIELRVLAAEGLGEFPDGSFEMVMTHGCFSGWLDPAAALAEVGRILRPGGYFYLRDWCRSAPREALAPYLDAAKGNAEHVRRVETAFGSSYTRDELDRLLTLQHMERLEFRIDGLWLTAVLRKPG